MPFLTLTNNQRILETQSFIVIPALALNDWSPTRQFGVCKSESLLLGEKLKHNSWASPTWNKMVSGVNACNTHLCLLLKSRPAWEARQKEFEQEKLSSFDDCMEYFME